MKKAVILLAAALCSGSLAMAQTKRIAHRSHSGTGTFSVTNSNDNFGVVRKVPPAPPKTDSNAIVKKKVIAHPKVKKTLRSSKSKTIQTRR